MKGFIFIICLFLIALAVRFYFFFNDGVTYKNGQQVHIETVLLSDSTQDAKSQHIIARLSHGERVFITATRDVSYSYGQALNIYGVLRIKEGENGTIYSMSFPQIKSTPASGILGGIAVLRSRLIWLFHSSLGQPEASLLLGVVFGIQEAMPKEFQKALQNAGVLHVIAASGMNVTMIAAFLSSILGRFLRRQYSLIVSLIIIAGYAVLSGLSASILRASLMGSLVFIAQLFGRQTMAIYLLCIAAIIMIFIQPFLLFDTGFQLSFTATCGLIVFSPLSQKILNAKGRVSVLLAETDFSTTIIAQIVTLPIILSTFGTYAPVGILVNFLVLWTIPMLMVIGGIGSLVGLFLPDLGRILLYLCLPFLYYFKAVVWFFGTLPGTISVSRFPWELTVGYYLLLIASLVFLKSLSFRTEGEKSHEE